MSSEQLADGVNPLDAELAATWDVLKGYSGRDTDLGIARRFGAAAAAYSLRDIGAMNGSVVRVRREPNDTTAGIDDEERFSANQVQDGTLEKWVNGELESTLPADVATAAAAYSLRKVKASYSGDAVRIRRSSDDIEVDVAFDSDGKVSASSAITNVAEQGGESGSTSATDLNGFLNESTENFSAIAYAGIDASYKNFTSDPTISETAFSGTNGGTASRLCYSLPLQLTISEADGCKFKVTGTIDSLSGGNVTIKPTTQNNGAGSYTPAEGNKVISDGTTGAFEYIFTGNGVNEFKSVIFIIDASTTVSASNLKFEIIEHGATVHTWYDQAGSNDAVQATASNQPKIAESGALLADGLDFDGSNDEMVLTSVLGATTVQSIFAVQKNDITSGGSLLFDNRDANDDGSALFATDSAGNKQASWDAADAEHTATTNEELIGLIKTSSAITFRANGVQKSSTSSSSTIDISNVPKIGQGSFGVAGTNYDGSIKEIICYNSDQSNNRFKIESNINNYYSLYNDANEFSGNPTAEVTPSAITLTNVSKTGFTAEIDATSGTKQINFPLINSLVSGDDYFVSFDYTSTSTSTVGVKPRTAALGSASNDVISATNSGFYGGTGDAGHNGFDVNNTATVLSFQTTANSFTFTVSNLRASRIARNGFVETWYDQSGNFRPLIQANASEQPSIVENGGFLGGVKADVATSNDTMQNLQVSTDGTTANFGTDDWANGGTKLGLMYVGSTPDTANTSSPCIIWGGGRGVSSFQTGGLSLQVIKGGTDSWRLVNERQGLSPSVMNTAVSLNSDSDIILYGIADNRDFTIKVNASSNADTESADLDTREGAPISLFGAYDQNSNRYYQRSSSGVCKECYLFSGDNITEVDTISTEINKHYNIY